MKIKFDPWLCSWPTPHQGFPRRFWDLFCKHYKQEPLLHLFCGGSTDGHTRVDIREDSGATIVGDFQEVTLPTNHQSAFADPPYTQEFADEWGVKCPRPSDILRVMQSACVPGAILAILHLQVIRPLRSMEKVAWHPVFCGTTKHIRCLSVFRLAKAAVTPDKIFKALQRS